MSLTTVKKAILETMASESLPKKPKDIAKKTGLNFSSCMMHILGLKKAGYVSSPEKGYYQITNLGKGVLKPSANRELAISLLEPLDSERTFYFYNEINEYSGMYATSLPDFCEKVKSIDSRSIEFHILRKDFERWLESIGDSSLANRMSAIRETETMGEELRRLVYEAARARCSELSSLAKSS
jgi:predicted transcriptional regulator